MERRYYANEGNTSVMQSGGLLPPPEGWREISLEEYEAIRGVPEHPPVRTLAEVRAEQAAAEADGGQTAAPKARAEAKPKGK